MNIIWLTPEIPYPPIGGRNGVYNRIVQLSKYNNIFLFSIAYNEDEKNSIDAMKEYCMEVHYYNRNENKLKKIVKSLFAPYSVASRTLTEIKQDIKYCLSNNQIDVVITDFPNMAKNLKGLELKCFCTLNQHNIEYRRMREMYGIKTISYLKRLAYWGESYRLEKYEKKLYASNLFQSITFFSTDDCAEFSEKWTNCRADLKVFPLGSNSVKNTKKCNDEEHNTFLFVGRLDDIATTNVEAIIWFYNKVLPIIEKEINIKIVIAGANPSGKIMNLAKDNVAIIPNYSKLEDVYSLADYVILPLLSGGGVKGKLLEAAAFEKTIISTKHGIEGTDFQPDIHVYYAETSEEFAGRCIDAVKNTEYSRQLAINSKRLFEKRYNWNQIGIDYYNYLKSSVKVGNNED